MSKKNLELQFPRSKIELGAWEDQFSHPDCNQASPPSDARSCNPIAGPAPGGSTANSSDAHHQPPPDHMAKPRRISSPLPKRRSSSFETIPSFFCFCKVVISFIFWRLAISILSNFFELSDSPGRQKNSKRTPDRQKS